MPRGNKDLCHATQVTTAQPVALSTCPPPAVPPADRSGGPAAQGRKIKFTWRIENFVAFKEIMETRKIFSRHALSASFLADIS
jgi:hypothetical protein